MLIVGGGLAGLACAIRLHEAGAQPAIFEASDAVGGRVRTDLVDGFLLDRGFQVYLDAYPEAGKLLDKASLDLRPLSPARWSIRAVECSGSWMCFAPRVTSGPVLRRRSVRSQTSCALRC